MSNHTFRTELTTYLQAEQDALYRLAYSYMQNEQDALDVLQTAIVKALCAPRMREPDRMRTWVYRIVVHTAIDGLRARRRLVPSDDAAFEGQADPSQPGEGLYVRDLLDGLPTDLRAVVVLRYFHELQLREVAEVLDLNLSTVKTRLYRALELLRIEVEGDHE